MENLPWIIIGGFLMSAIALLGGVAALLNAALLERLLMPLISLAAGTLLGSALFHMLPEGIESLSALSAMAYLAAGFVVFLGLEQFLHWHHSHGEAEDPRKPVGYLVLIGDGLHNLLGGIGIASTFLIDPRAGIVAWVSAAAHEVPQELGDFGILVHGGWSRRRALLWNFVSALSFPLGAIAAYMSSDHIDLAGLVLFGAGNFIYIAASDLIPEIKAHEKLGSAMLHFGLVVAGLLLTFILALFGSH